MFRTCKICNKIKELGPEHFQPSLDVKQGKIYFKRYCRVCERQRCKIYHKNNQTKILVRKRSLYKENSEYERERNRAYSKTDIGRNKHNERARKRRYKNPCIKLRENISHAIWRALRMGKSNKKGQSIMKYLNYTLLHLITHLESQFDCNMSWDNYGLYWHLDHIIPQSDLPFASMKEENFKICWLLDNLRPLEAKQNMIDGVTRARHRKKK